VPDATEQTLRCLFGVECFLLQVSLPYKAGRQRLIINVSLSYHLDEGAFRSGAPPKGVIPLAASAAGAALIESSEDDGDAKSDQHGANEARSSGATVEELLRGPSSYQFVIHAALSVPTTGGKAGDGRVFFVQAASADELDTWVAAVRGVISGNGAGQDVGGSGTGGGAGEGERERPQRTFGLLKKRGENNTAFQERYFVLEGGVVSYFKDEIAFALGHEPNGSFSLRAAQVALKFTLHPTPYTLHPTPYTLNPGL
jgi:hypothetical protein